MNDLTRLSDQLPIDPDRRPLASARYVPPDDLNRQGYFRGDFWLGRTLVGRPFGWNEEMNLLTCAGPGAGKGVGTVIPNLLEFPGSVVVVDPKGELAAKTAAYRRDVLGQKVIVLDPTRSADVPEELRGTYNPFDDLDPDDPNVVTAAQVLAEGIVVPNPKANEPFWDDNALDFIQSCILYMVKHYAPDAQTLIKLRETVSSGDKLLYEAFCRQQKLEDPTFVPSAQQCFRMFLEEMGNTTDFGGVVSETGHNLAGVGEQTLGNLRATARTHTQFLNAPELHDVLQSNIDPSRTFQLSELRRQDRPLTVYLCLPVDMMPRQGRWFRMIILRMIQYIQRSEARFHKDHDHPILMMIDEFFQLGPIPSLVNTLTYARSAGLRLWLIVQDLNQVKHNYPESWETVLGACGIKQFFGVNDLVTAEYISKFIGEQEVDVPSISITKTLSNTESENTSETTGEGTNETTGTSDSHGLTETTGTSHSEGVSTTTGSNRSATRGTSDSRTTSKGWNQSESRTAGTSATNSVSTGTNTSSGRSDNYAVKPRFFFLGGGLEHSGVSESTGSGTSRGESRSLGTSDSISKSAGSNTSASETTGTNRSFTEGTSESTARTVTEGTSNSTGLSRTRGTSTSRGSNRSTSRTAGTGLSVSKGENYALTMAKQRRSLLRPEEVLLAFTKDNLLQLTLIRDQGGMMLMRTPYFADPFFRRLLIDADTTSE